LGELVRGERASPASDPQALTAAEIQIVGKAVSLFAIESVADRIVGPFQAARWLSGGAHDVILPRVGI
jgi:hypothetical protein